MDRARPAPSIVLVVDDAIDVRTRLCALLSEQCGATAVACSASATQAVLEEARAVRPHCVIVDAPTRDASGFQLLAMLRAVLPRCLLIALTNHVTEEFRERSLLAGADFFFGKSTDLDRVVELVRTLRGAS